jgi:hypothetical protein
VTGLALASKRRAPRLAVIAGALFCLTFVQPASGTHIRPKGATPKRDSLAISFKSCAAPTLVHSAPSSYGSCTPAPKSTFLTVGTPDANSLPVNFVGYTDLTVCNAPGGCAPGPPGADIKVTSLMTDIRCTAAMVASNPAVCPSGSLGAYTGSLRANFPTQLTDHCNGAAAPPCPAPTPPPPNAGTGPSPGPFSLPVPFVIPCAPAGPGMGATCGLTTTYNVVMPGFVVAGMRGNFEIGRVTVEDGGPDGNGATTDNTEFLGAGVFVP